MCDGLKSAGSWLVDNIKEILVVGLAVLAVVVVVALAIATFGLGAVAIAALVGVAAGLASQLITDIASGFVTGKFKFVIHARATTTVLTSDNKITIFSS